MRPFDQAWALLKASDINLSPYASVRDESGDMKDANNFYLDGGHGPSQGDMPVMVGYDAPSGGDALGQTPTGMETLSTVNPYAQGKSSDEPSDLNDQFAIQHLLHGPFQQAPIVNAMASIGEDVSGFPKQTVQAGRNPISNSNRRSDYLVGEPHPDMLDPLRSTLVMPKNREPMEVEQQFVAQQAEEKAAQEKADRAARAQEQVRVANANRLERAKAEAAKRQRGTSPEPSIDAAMAALRARQKELGIE